METNLKSLHDAQERGYATLDWPLIPFDTYQIRNVLDIEGELDLRHWAERVNIKNIDNFIKNFKKEISVYFAVDKETGDFCIVPDNIPE